MSSKIEDLPIDKRRKTIVSFNQVLKILQIKSTSNRLAKIRAELSVIQKALLGIAGVAVLDSRVMMVTMILSHQS